MTSPELASKMRTPWGNAGSVVAAMLTLERCLALRRHERRQAASSDEPISALSRDPRHRRRRSHIAVGALQRLLEIFDVRAGLVLRPLARDRRGSLRFAQALRQVG